MLKQTLIQIGFNLNEAKIYIALVELGPQPANQIAKRVGLKRPTIYPIIKNLQQKSLIGSFIRNGVQFFSVNDVHNLLEFIERKRRFVEHQRDFVVDIIPKIELLRGSLSLQPKVHYYEGKDGVETVVNMGEKTNGPIFFITSPEKWVRSELYSFIKDFMKNIVIKGDKKLRILSKDTAEARCFFDEYGVGVNGCTRDDVLCVKYIRDNDVLFDNIVHIYDNKVGIVSPDVGSEYGVLIESEEFAKTQKTLFELAWKGVSSHNYNFDKNGK